ncbi:substrate-binding domain-containing protein [Rhodococcus sp. USK13]|uniref:sugar ABC transporter substrate-binding protein n=1 Tax=Rhodococcus sp. USK13 TaxID=2806442 RepID=UPI001BD15F73|nr:substrate-binding domain-containing protein [Rhodococcus sp. USK13]
MSSYSRRRFLPGLKKLSGCAAVVVLTLGFAGCTSGGSSSSDGVTDGPRSAQVQTACDRAEAGTAEVQFKAPGGAVDGTALEGKSIYVIPIINTGTVTEYTRQMEEGGALLGASVVTIDAKGSIPAAVTAFNQAIARGADVIVNVAVQSDLVKEPMLKAQAAGIKVIDVVNGQPDEKAPEGVDGRVSWDYIKGGKWRMDKAICDTNGHLELGLISSDDLPTGKYLMEGMQAEFDELCTDDCSIVTANVPSANWATGLASATTSLVQKNPNLNYLMPAFGGMVVPVLPTMNRIDPRGEIQVSSFDLESALFEPLKSGEIRADVGTSFGGLAWPTFDQALRLVSGQAAVIEEGPARMVTSEMAESLGLSADNSMIENRTLIFGNLATGDDYKKLWGIK